MKDVFQFKQFSVYQDGCAMKVNTDGVLLALLCAEFSHHHILDIGTGTGVIALICAQRFTQSNIHAVEIDVKAAVTAAFNFEISPFSKRLKLFTGSFQNLDTGERKYDLIISNPPFFLNSLKNQDESKSLARHASFSFFNDLLNFSLKNLTDRGYLEMILPVDIATFVIEEAEKKVLFLNNEITVFSYSHSKPHRKIIRLSKTPRECMFSQFVIYDKIGSYTEEYQNLLRNYFTIF